LFHVIRSAELAIQPIFISTIQTFYMSKTVGDFLVERLLAWNVTRTFGYAGDDINGIMGALDRAKNKIDFIQTQHE